LVVKIISQYLGWYPCKRKRKKEERNMTKLTKEIKRKWGPT
jgi:hypothetical protein